jgi:hypothetical protein
MAKLEQMRFVENEGKVAEFAAVYILIVYWQWLSSLIY